ncbi:MAG: cadmium-translocating P-type ATPase [Lachnospiraceae bacterium]|nr:cadmium-translocating P-type ATPase [Lachnospiraceae bacterium]
MTKKQKKVLIRIIISAVLVVLFSVLPVSSTVELILFAAAYLIAGYDILRKAIKGIINGQVFDENFLMAVATVGAIALGEYREGVAVMVFYQIGELFQSYAVGKSRRNIAELMDIRPDTANLETDGGIETVDPDDVEVGSIIVVRPGEKIPIDGTVESGESYINTSALTGESVPRSVRPGDAVLSGCINENGVLRVRTEKEFGESTASKILDMVENAGSLKSKSENFISKFARVYTPAVCIAALVIAVIPPLVRMGVLGTAPEWRDWLFRAFTFLVISCPCALVISIPLSFFAGIGGASHEGILVKGANYLEALANTGAIAFDKTGTVTQGVFEVSGIHHSPLGEKELLGYAAAAEFYSTHPISQSLKAAWGEEIDESQISDVAEYSGEGVTASVSGKKVAVGNARLMKRLGVEYMDCHSVGTAVHVAIDGEYAGHILIADALKPGAALAMDKLRNMGVRRLVMMTGDTDGVARNVAGSLGITEVKSELMPEDKVAEVEQLINEKKLGEMVAFAGDGINDAPVLSRADIGIAMGAMGSDAAIEAADIVLMDDDPAKIAKAVAISRKCMRIVRQNIVFSLAVKGICLILGAVGYANMWMAIFADVGVMVIAVLNAIRALRVKNL